jgi:hypothetical protein
MTTPNLSHPIKQIGKNLTDFRALHDKSFIVPKKITDGLKALGDGWEYELGFLRLSGLSTNDLAAYREPFEEFIVIVNGKNPKRVWCGTKALAEKLRAMV